MIIGIDASRAFIDQRTGTENYSYHLINEILRLPESNIHTFVLFIRPNTKVPRELAVYTNVIVKEVRWKYLWTQLGLAWETWKNPNLQVLWIPAHTLPVWRNPRLKTVVTIHGLEYQWLPEYKNWLQRWYLPLSTIYAAKHANQLIAVSNFTKSQLIKELQNRSNRPEADQPWAGKIKVIHEGVDIAARIQDLEFSDHSVLQYGLKKKKYVLFVGTIQPRKNLVALIEAFSYFAMINPDYKLVIAGGTGWMAEEIFKLPGQAGVQEKVVFTGRVNDRTLFALYDQAAMYVQPSLTEGFGLPILEAMQAKVPVISSDGGALSEVVGKAGVIVALNPKESFPHRLAEEMEKLVKSESSRTKLIELGKKRVKELNWFKTAKETLNTLISTGLSQNIT